MINIRSNIFETNSSSSHSIVINKTNSIIRGYDDIEIKDGIYNISSRLIFDRWPFGILPSVDNKTRFTIASLANYYEKGTEAFFDELTNIFKKHYPELKEIKVAFEEYDGKKYYGEIDHQSSGLLQSFLNKNNISFEEFIFNPKYVVIIDGDEYHEFKKLCNSGIIDKAKIEIFGGEFDE